jgi:hypothetical protein
VTTLSSSNRVVDLRRHELRRVVATMDNGRGWTVRPWGYTAHALYRYGPATGHVIGTATGWWWGLQTELGQTPTATPCGDLIEACATARNAARQWVQRRVPNPGRPRREPK